MERDYLVIQKDESDYFQVIFIYFALAGLVKEAMLARALWLLLELSAMTSA